MNGTIKKPVLILGATSAIARACAAEFASQGYPLFLAGRDTDELQRIADDIAIRYSINIQHGNFDADDTASHENFMGQVLQDIEGLSGVLLAFGYLGDQQQAQQNIEMRQKIISRNFTGAASILSLCANHLEDSKQGFIVGLSSVAGDRGRQSNYTYGAAKGALSIFLQGLRNRLASSNVRVITIKPGFIDTAMTFGMPGLFLVASPEYAAKRIVQSIKRRPDVVYIPWFWRYIMIIIRLIPEFIFKRMKL